LTVTGFSVRFFLALVVSAEEDVEAPDPGAVESPSAAEDEAALSGPEPGSSAFVPPQAARVRRRIRETVRTGAGAEARHARTRRDMQGVSCDVEGSTGYVRITQNPRSGKSTQQGRERLRRG